MKCLSVCVSSSSPPPLSLSFVLSLFVCPLASSSPSRRYFVERGVSPRAVPHTKKEKMKRTAQQLDGAHGDTEKKNRRKTKNKKEEGYEYGYVYVCTSMGARWDAFTGGIVQPPPAASFTSLFGTTLSSCQGRRPQRCSRRRGGFRLPSPRAHLGDSR